MFSANLKKFVLNYSKEKEQFTYFYTTTNIMKNHSGRMPDFVLIIVHSPTVLSIVKKVCEKMFPLVGASA